MWRVSLMICFNQGKTTIVIEPFVRRTNKGQRLKFINLLFVDHSTIHTEKSNKMQEFIKIYYSIFIWSSTCFGWHTAHHQELKTALEASGFAYLEGCWTCGCWTLSCPAWQHPATIRPTKFHVWKPEPASAVLGSW